MNAMGDLSDLEKLQQSLAGVLAISSFDDVLAIFGLLDMPRAQKLGIVFGCITFALTVTAVLTLLTMGGTWKRIEEQTKSGELVTAPDSITQRKRRALLLERLLEARDRMIKINYPSNDNRSTGFAKSTPLTNMLMTSAPEDENAAPAEYTDSYKSAYRRCQDKPGGPILGGRPNHRFESYARAFAGCGVHTSLTYRWSYARMYETMAGKSHESDERFKKLFQRSPTAVVGASCRLEPLDSDVHLKELWSITSGDSCNEHKAYNPDEVWGFLNCGPFKQMNDMLESEVFQLQSHSAAFAVVDMTTDRVLGAVHLTKDDPKNLNVQMELPIVKPSSEGTVQQLEACFLLLDRLFAFGYRRIQMCVDVQDVRGKRLPNRLGFTQEGQIPKHMIVKEANRDSLIYGMLNSDWDKGARKVLFRKIHGTAAMEADARLVAKEEAVYEQEQELMKGSKPQ
ncbi:hypothetical protein THAOC_24079 [Thalassiosira oceanica]|uniref:N-acetyltransferase domain-containing protein n=1 Tax=Thalassiosira oceanica TaxID=159749 RepID=K0RSW9_THAOC|nr:hypothetical protein THAOC_24079 [Thalassiosira oceanica]|eukprot:EJK56100.1 hypothetical protein THAOC_24079 [Thalassiosira oceanica]